MPAARLRGRVRGHGRRRAVLRHLRSRPGGVRDGHGGVARDRRDGGRAAAPRVPPGAPRTVRAAPPGARAPVRGRTRTSSRSSRSRRSVSGRLSRALSGGSTGRSVSVRSSGSAAASSGRGRLGAGLVEVPGVPRPDPREMVLDDPEVPERKRFCSRSDCGAPVGRARGDRPGPHGGFLHQVRPPVLVRAEAEVRRRRARPVRGGGPSRARRARLGLPRRRPCGVRPLGGPQGSARHRRPGRDGRGDLRAALPRGDRARQHRADLQLRGAPRPAHRFAGRVHRHGVRRRQVAEGDRQRPARHRRAGATRCPWSRPARTASRPWRRSATCTAATCCTATSRSTTPSRPRTSSNSSTWARCAGWTTRSRRSTARWATRLPRSPRSAPRSPPTSTRSPGPSRSSPSTSRATRTSSRTPCPTPGTSRSSAGTSRSTGSSSAPPTPTRARRFASAQEMAEQLTGVLREVVSLQTGRARPALSTLFGPETKVTDTQLFGTETGEVSRLGARPVPGRGRGPAASTGAAGPPDGAALVLPVPAAAAALALPVPRVDPGDPNAGFLAGLVASAPAELIAALRAAPADSPELRLGELRARLETGGTGGGAGRAGGAGGGAPGRLAGGLVPRCRRRSRPATHEIAALSFDAVYDAFPGEPAPKLALGLCAEVLGQPDNAAEYYRLVWTTDPSLRERRVRPRPGAARRRGPRRRRQHAGVRARVVDPLHGGAGRRGAGTAAAQAATRPPRRRFLDDLTAAAGQVEALDGFGLDAVRREQLSTEVLGVRAGLGTLRWPGFRSGRRGGGTVLLGSASGRTWPAFRPRTFVPHAGPARAGRRGEDRPGGTCQPLPPPDVGVIDVPDAPADGPVAVPQLRGAAGGG